MKFFLAGLGNFYPGWKLVEEAVPAADEIGFYGIVMPDHFMWDWRDMQNRNSTVDTWTAFSYLAAKTRHLMLATLVTPIPFRPPGILAKIVSTLDVLSSGRTILGVGAGWSQTEFEGFSEWSDPKTRVDKTEEGVELIKKLWTENKVDFQGKFYTAKGAVVEPKPVQKPHPPLLFGGVGPRMLRMARRHADFCYIPPWTKMPFATAKSMVEKSARRAGRSNKIVFGRGTPTIRGETLSMKTLAEDIEKANADGCQFYLAAFPQDDYLPMMKQFSREILPSFATQTRLVAGTP